MRTFRILLLVVATLLMGVMATQAAGFHPGEERQNVGWKSILPVKELPG